MSISLKFVPVLIFAAGVLKAQSGRPSGQVETGRQLFLTNCAVCHGPDGDSVRGVDLGRGKFRRAASNEDLAEIIRAGIKDTGMPAFSQELTEVEMGMVVSYLRYMESARSESAPGDAVKGQALFEGRAGCLNCHRVRDRGSRLGPDLTDIGALRRAIELERSLLDPDSEILPQNRLVRIVTKGGEAIRGRLLNHDAFTIQLIDSQERLLAFPVSELREFAFEAHSPMPSYKKNLTAQELADLVSYLVSLKGIEHP